MIFKKEASDKLESANKSYHEMHAQFLSKRWENKHVYCGIQDHVCLCFYFIYFFLIFNLIV